MWRNFFYYSRQQRIVVVLSIMIMLVSVIIIFLYSGNTKSEKIAFAPSDSIDEFIENIKVLELPTYKSHKNNEIQFLPHIFDPNKEDSASMLNMGLPKYVVSNIVKYRNKKGVFKSVSDLRKIYGMDETLFRKLEPYVSIDIVNHLEKKSKGDSIFKKDTVTNKFSKGTYVDLNNSDTTVLKRVPGIGINIAKMIIAYRNMLGGFYSVEQLDEIEYVNDDMKKWFVVDSINTTKININKVSLDRLRNHPYINFYQAKVIIEFRKKRGKIRNLSQLSLFDEFTEKDLNRLKYYVSFD